jgi:nitronate monooxygenase
MTHPLIIQGGMGVAVSNWRLARAVSQLGQLGVVSGTIIGVVMARRLQSGDPGGHMARALSHFPVPEIVERIMRRYYVPEGKSAGAPHRAAPMPAVAPSASWLELTVAASFAEVFLAREGHTGPVGVNLLEKLQVATLASLYGAMLAGVGYVLMGAGIPRSIPGVLDRFSEGVAAELKIDADGAAPGAEPVARFDPKVIFGENVPVLARPQFLAIVSSATLALTLARKSNGRVDGFVVEGALAGGHNAPPRGPLQLDAGGEPIYGPRDLPDLPKIAEIGLPFWLAGSCATPEQLAIARAAGAAGIQVGTAFAFCEESGIEPEIKRRIYAEARAGRARVFTDPIASPTGFPFKVLQLDGTLSGADVYAARKRVCDLGYLRQAYLKSDGSLGYRCSAEPVEDFVAKGGKPEAVEGRKCLCNGLLATVGLGQVRADGTAEPPIITAGNDVEHLARFMRDDDEFYSAADVVSALLGEEPATRHSAHPAIEAAG